MSLGVKFSKMALLLTLLIFVTTPTRAAEVNECYVLEAELAYLSGNLQELSTVGKLVETYLLGPEFGKGKMAEEEAKFLRNNPQSALVIKGAACRSMAITYALCGVSMKKREFSRAWYEETDALRHFTNAAFLVCGQGKKMAETYTIAHEGPPPWPEDERMDIHNNYVGMEWAGDLVRNRCTLSMSDKSLARAGLEQLMADKLVVNQTGSTDCMVPEEVWRKLEEESEFDFSQRVNEMHRDLQKALPQFCG